MLKQHVSSNQVAWVTDAGLPGWLPAVQAPTQQEVSVFENERFMPLRGWSPNFLLPTDRSRYTGPRGQEGATFPQVGLEPGENLTVIIITVK